MENLLTKNPRVEWLLIVDFACGPFVFMPVAASSIETQIHSHNANLTWLKCLWSAATWAMGSQLLFLDSTLYKYIDSIWGIFVTFRCLFHQNWLTNREVISKWRSAKLLRWEASFFTGNVGHNLLPREPSDQRVTSQGPRVSDLPTQQSLVILLGDFLRSCVPQGRKKMAFPCCVEFFKRFLDSGNDPDLTQSLFSWSLSPFWPSLKISLKSVCKSLCEAANSPRD